MSSEHRVPERHVVDELLDLGLHAPVPEFNLQYKGSYQKLLSGFFPLRGGRYPPFPLSFFGQNDFPLRPPPPYPQFR